MALTLTRRPYAAVAALPPSSLPMGSIASAFATRPENPASAMGWRATVAASSAADGAPRTSSIKTEQKRELCNVDAWAKGKSARAASLAEAVRYNPTKNTTSEHIPPTTGPATAKS